MRNLNAGDVFKLAGFIAEAMPGNLAELKNKSATEVGLMIATGILKSAPRDLPAWLADIAGMTLDEFNAQPMSFPIQLLGTIFGGDEAKDFFSQLQSLLGLIRQKPLT